MSDCRARVQSVPSSTDRSVVWEVLQVWWGFDPRKIHLGETVCFEACSVPARLLAMIDIVPDNNRSDFISHVRSQLCNSWTEYAPPYIAFVLYKVLTSVLTSSYLFEYLALTVTFGNRKKQTKTWNPESIESNWSSKEKKLENCDGTKLTAAYS